MRKLTQEELFSLKSVVEDGVRYLTLQTSSESERLFRMTFPTHLQRQQASLAKHKYYSELGKRRKEGLKTRREVEKEYQAELKELRQQMREYSKQGDRVRRDFIEKLAAGEKLPDAEADPEGFNQAVYERMGAEIEDLSEQMSIIGTEIEDILQYCIENLAANEEIARLTQMCWGQLDEAGEYQPVWKTWEEYANDSNPLARLLFNETRYWIQGGIPPFAS